MPAGPPTIPARPCSRTVTAKCPHLPPCDILLTGWSVGVRAETGGPCTARALLLEVPWSLASPWRFWRCLRPRFWAWRRISPVGPPRPTSLLGSQPARKRRPISRGPQPPLRRQRLNGAGRRRVRPCPPVRPRSVRSRRIESNRRRQKHPGPPQFKTQFRTLILALRPQPHPPRMRRR